jgi:hypothetical protein
MMIMASMGTQMFLWVETFLHYPIPKTNSGSLAWVSPSYVNSHRPKAAATRKIIGFLFKLIPPPKKRPRAPQNGTPRPNVMRDFV